LPFLAFPFPFFFLFLFFFFKASAAFFASIAFKRANSLAAFSASYFLIVSLSAALFLAALGSGFSPRER
jgi:hypothetical protein